jgi:hypothetical protein
MATIDSRLKKPTSLPVEGVTEMPNITYFVQDCPTCGRKLNIRVEYLGKKVVCQHCNGMFLAWDPEGAAPTPSPESLSGTKLLERAQELIELAESKINESRIMKTKIDPNTVEISR